jgi:glycosyltransferase involved in cell wall biosynthesis
MGPPLQTVFELMRILHITPYYHPAMGGAETHAREISERLALRGHDVSVLTMNSRRAPGSTSEPLRETEVINGVAVHRFNPLDRLQDVFNGFLKIRGAHRLLGLALGMDSVQMLAIGPCTLRAFQFTMRFNPDVVAVSNWYCGSLAYQTCLARRFRHFALVGIPFFHTERHWSHSSLYARMLERCDAVVALTDHEKSFIGQRSTRNNVHVVGVGVDPAAFLEADGRRIRDRCGIGDAPLVGYVGRMTAVKGVATLIEAMRTVWRTQPCVRLLLAGSGVPAGRNRRDPIALALAGLSGAERSRIISVGHFGDDDKASIFDALDLFVMPSIAESFGIAYLEAWVCQKAVIGARIGSTRCVIDDGIDGALVAPGSSEDLAGSILRLLSDPVRREKMGRAGRSKTMTRFTWDAITDRVEHIYHQVHAANVSQQPADSGGSRQAAESLNQGEPEARM